MANTINASMLVSLLGGERGPGPTIIEFRNASDRVLPVDRIELHTNTSWSPTDGTQPAQAQATRSAMIIRFRHPDDAEPAPVPGLDDPSGT